MGIASKTPTTPTPISEEKNLFNVEPILVHRRRGRGYEWLTLMQNSNTHNEQWQSNKDCIDANGTLTKAFHDCIIEEDTLKHFH